MGKQNMSVMIPFMRHEEIAYIFNTRKNIYRKILIIEQEIYILTHK